MIHQHVPAKSITCLEISKLGPVCPLHKNTSRLPLKKHAGSIGTIQLHLGYCRSYFLRSAGTGFNDINLRPKGDITEPPTCNSTSEVTRVMVGETQTVN